MLKIFLLVGHLPFTFAYGIFSHVKIFKSYLIVYVFYNDFLYKYQAYKVSSYPCSYIIFTYIYHQ